MMQLIIVVLAIGLAALLAVGGVTYFSTDIGLRVEVQQALRAQHDAISTAVSSYRTANNGFVHSDIGRLTAYLPDGRIPKFPGGGEPFTWTIDKEEGQFRGLCLTRNPAQAMSKGVAQGIASFANDRGSRHPGTVTFGTRGGSGSCGLADEPEPVKVGKDSLLDAAVVSGDSGAVISFRGF